MVTDRELKDIVSTLGAWAVESDIRDIIQDDVVDRLEELLSKLDEELGT